MVWLCQMPAVCVVLYMCSNAVHPKRSKMKCYTVLSSAGFCGLLEVVQVTCLEDSMMMQQRPENPIRWLRTFLGHQSSLKVAPNAPTLRVRTLILDCNQLFLNIWSWHVVWFFFCCCCFMQEVRQVEYLAILSHQLSHREICPQVDKPATYSEVQKRPLCKARVEAIQISQRYWNSSQSASHTCSQSPVWTGQWCKLVTYKPVLKWPITGLKWQ